MAKVSSLLCAILVLVAGSIVGCRKLNPPSSAPSETMPTATYSFGDHYFQINIGGLDRTYSVHVPRGYDGKRSLPVVIVFHGGGGTGKGTMEITGMATKADQAGFLAVFPDGTAPFPNQPAKFVNNPQTWNDGSGRGHSGKRNVDDVGFINGMIDALASKFTIDEKRLFATGLSNGASMSFRLGVELSHRIAAIAPVAGSFWMEVRQINRPVPLLYVTGTEDPLNPLEGGQITVPWWGYTDIKPPVQESITKWARLLGCPTEPQIVSDNEGVRMVTYKPCQQGSEIIYYTVEGLGHNWPGGKPYLPQGIVGKTSNKIIANDVIWDFFQRHPMK